METTLAFIKKYWIIIVGLSMIAFSGQSMYKKHTDTQIVTPQHDKKIAELQQKAADQIKTTPVDSSNLDEAINKWNNI